MEENKMICSHCGALIDDDDYGHVNGEVVCSDCVERYCCRCERCGALIYDSETFGDDYINLCRRCYENHYTHCYNCDILLLNDDTYEYDGEYYCAECHYDLCNDGGSIKDYNYKPEPIFYGDTNRYFGVELEIDIGGKTPGNADELLHIGNRDDECIYIKSDGSLNDGMEYSNPPDDA